MKNIRRVMISIVLLTGLVYSLAGCSPTDKPDVDTAQGTTLPDSTVKSGKNIEQEIIQPSLTPKSDKDIAQEIMQSDSIMSRYDLRIIGQTVSKRQTNEDQKTDYVWITISAECDNFLYVADYTAEYVLYNDGWLLETFECTDYDYTGNESLFQQEEPLLIAKEYLKSNYDYFQFQGKEIDFENQIVRFQFKTLNRSGFADYCFQIEIWCAFYPRQEPAWELIDTVVLQESQDWRRLLGTYECFAGYWSRENLTLTIMDWHLENGKLASLDIYLYGTDYILGDILTLETDQCEVFYFSPYYHFSIFSTGHDFQFRDGGEAVYLGSGSNNTRLEKTSESDMPDFMDEFFLSDSEIEYGTKDQVQ